MTIHKSQGASFDGAYGLISIRTGVSYYIISTGKQSIPLTIHLRLHLDTSYVAVSRVRNINNLFIVGRPFERGDFYIHEEARLLIREEYLRLERTGCGSMNIPISFPEFLSCCG